MKDKNFIIKAWDLLKEWGKVDSIDFENKMTSELPNLNKEGISGSILLRSLNQNSLYVSFENISCTLEETCDRCWANYKRIIEVPEYISRFVINEKIKQEEQETSEEEIFVINDRDETIDVEPMIVQAIKLQDPFVNYCPKCEKELEKISDEDEFDEEVVWWGNIIFH